MTTLTGKTDLVYIFLDIYKLFPDTSLSAHSSPESFCACLPFSLPSSLPFSLSFPPPWFFLLLHLLSLPDHGPMSILTITSQNHLTISTTSTIISPLSFFFFKQLACRLFLVNLKSVYSISRSQFKAELTKGQERKIRWWRRPSSHASKVGFEPSPCPLGRIGWINLNEVSHHRRAGGGGRWPRDEQYALKASQWVSRGETAGSQTYQPPMPCSFYPFSQNLLGQHVK